jgi:hypothetical protein
MLTLTKYVEKILIFKYNVDIIGIYKFGIMNVNIFCYVFDQIL